MTAAEQKMLFEGIGARIRKFRSQNELSQKALGERVGKSRTSIVNIERGHQHPPLDLIIDLSKALKVPLLDILGKEVVSATGEALLEKDKASLQAETKRGDGDYSQVLDFVNELGKNDE